MKKRWILIPLVLLLTLAACTPDLLPTERVPDTQLSAQPNTLPTETDPTEPSVTPTEPAVSHPPFEKLSIFIYHEGHNYSYINTSEISKCQEGYLYYYYDTLRKIAPLCDEPVVDFAYDNVNFFFVKESEPTKLYCAPQTDLMQQEVIYESDFGTINDVYSQYGSAYGDKVVTLTEGNKRLVLLDITTAEMLVVFDKAYYIKHGSFEGLTEVDGKPYYSKVLFDGQPTEDDRSSAYFYWVNEEVFTEMPMQ